MASNVVKLDQINFAHDPVALLRHILANSENVVDAVVVLKLRNGNAIDHSTLGDADTLWELEQCKRRLIEP